MWAADGAQARRLSGSFAGCSRPAPALGSQQSRHAVSHPAHSHTARRLRRQLTKMLAGAAAVPSNVRIVTKDSVRVKRILAEVQVQASVDQVWKVLTDYNRLADFVPNLEYCERVAGGPAGKQRLRQRACSQSLYWRLQAEAVLDVHEVHRSLGRRELHFTMVEGDFQQFSGRWILDPDPSVQNGLSLATVLRYEVSIVPKWSLPSTIITTIVRCGLPANVRAIATRAEQIAQLRRMAPKFAKAALADEPLPQAWANLPPAEGKPTPEEVLPAKGPARTSSMPAETVLQNNLEAKGRILKSEGPAYLGLSSVPLPFPVPRQTKARGWEKVLPRGESQTLEERQRQQDVRASYPSFTADNGRAAPSDESVEVHLRRLDDPLTLHRRAVASITIEASPEEVWEVLTDYERLPEFVPNLAVSERLPTPAGAPDRLVRLRQVGYKSMMYMHLQAEAVLALVESPCSEIQFRQISGDFQLLQGKFMLQDATLPEAKLWSRGGVTTLKYAVEVEIPRSAAMLGLLEPLLERVVYQDIPANLEAIKKRAEQQRIARQLAAAEAQGDGARAKRLRNLSEGRPAVKQMAADFALLAAELRRVLGEEGPMPRRTVLRNLKRYDLEEAVAAHGGPVAVAARLGWEMGYKVKTAWSSLEATQQAFARFAGKEGLPQHTLPSLQTLQRARRKDLITAAEEWGGVEGLAELLECQVADDAAAPSSSIAAETAGVPDVEALVNNRRPKRGQMMEDFAVLAEELKRCFGEDGPLPTSTDIRNMKRHDLTAAIVHHGGVAEVSKRLGWSRDFRPPNYWADLDNCRAELDGFCREEGLPLGSLPSIYSMQQAKRYDLQGAVRSWGGIYKLAEALGYSVLSESSGEHSSASDAADCLHSNAKKPAKKRKGKSGGATAKSLRDEIDSW